MSTVRSSKSLCAVVGIVLASTGSHATLDALFISAGVPGEPLGLPHHSKWKEWMFRAGQDANVNSLAMLGNLLEEFMDVAPKHGTPEFESWQEKRERIEFVLEENGLRYYRFCRVLPQGEPLNQSHSVGDYEAPTSPAKPAKVEELIELIVRGLRRAMHPLTHRR